VAFQGEKVFHRLEDALDSLADWCEVGPSGLVLVASEPHDGRAESLRGGLKITPGPLRVTNDRQHAPVTSASEQLRSDHVRRALLPLGARMTKEPAVVKLGQVSDSDQVVPRSRTR
jgi:hypothetical protein